MSGLLQFSLLDFQLSQNNLILSFSSQLMADLNAFIAKTQDTKNSTPALRFYICSKVEEVLERRTTTMPDRLESYVSFCDLSFVIRHSNDKVWHTFCLKGEIMIF